MKTEKELEKIKIEKKLEKFSKEFDKLLAKYEDIVVCGDVNGDLVAFNISNSLLQVRIPSFPPKKV